MRLIRKARYWVKRLTRRRGYGISFLVPFRTDNGRRAETWNWLVKYWRHELPGAEIVIGTDTHTPFCKTAAVNRAARKAVGDIYVILDADCFLPGDVIEHCAREIRRERKRGNRLWFMPYRYFYRLTDVASRRFLNSDPTNPPYYFAHGPEDRDLDDKKGLNDGHWFGALIQVMPREAFELVGGMDTRFRGWGGEDVAFLHALDTIYSQHKTAPGGVIHLWHPSLGSTLTGGRKWEGQKRAGNNGGLAAEYFRAMGQPDKMIQLVESNDRIDELDEFDSFYE